MKIFSRWGEESGIGSYALRADNIVLNSGKDLYQPDWLRGLQAKAMLVVKVGKVAKSIDLEFAHRYYEQVSLAISLRADSLSDGLPGRMREDFDGSFIRWSEWVRYEELVDREFSTLRILSPKVLSERVPLVVPSESEIATAIAEVSKYYLLKIGDWIALSATPSHFSVEPSNGVFVYEGEGKEVIYVGIK